MGNDGGSIPRRDELVKTAKKEKRKDSVEADRVHWNLCTLSKEPLQEPIVVDKLGFFMNKEALLKALLLKTMPPELNYIRSIKDVYTVHLKRNSDWKQLQQQQQQQQLMQKPGAPFMFCPFVCPVSLEPASGQDKFVAIVPCGCVVSLKSYQEVPSESCLVCGKPVERVIYINQSPERLAASKKALEVEIAERMLKDKKKKKKSKKKGKKEDDAGNDDDDDEAVIPPSHKKAKRSLSSSSSLPPPPPGANSDVYKSLFRSSSKEGEKMSGNDLFLGKSGKAGVL